MTAIQDLGEVTDTRTEWYLRETNYNGRTEDVGSGEEGQARNLFEDARIRMSFLNERERYCSGVEHVNLVSHTVTEYAGGHTLIGPWEVAK